MNLAQLPVAMRQLLVVLLAHHSTGSFTVAGLAGAACGLGLAMTSPVFGWLVGRQGARPILLATGAAHLAALLGLTVTADPVLFVVLAGAAGVSTPPVLSSGRALLPQLVNSTGLARAYGINAVGQELLYVGGPLAVSASLAVGGPGGAMLVFVAIGTAALVAHAAVVPAGTAGTATAGDADGPAGTSDDGKGGPAIWALIGVHFGYMICMGAMWVLVPVFASAAGHPNQSGVLVAVWSAGSLVGGLVLAARGRRLPIVRMYLLLLAALAVTALALPLPRTMPQMAFAVAVFGLPLAPWLAVADELVSRTAPGTRTAEFFGWLQSAGQVGIAVGAGLAGPISTRTDATMGFFIVPLALAGALALGLRARHRLVSSAERSASSYAPVLDPSL